jgi:hypothetical protein
VGLSFACFSKSSSYFYFVLIPLLSTSQQNFAESTIATAIRILSIFLPDISNHRVSGTCRDRRLDRYDLIPYFTFLKLNTRVTNHHQIEYFEVFLGRVKLLSTLSEYSNFTRTVLHGYLRRNCTSNACCESEGIFVKGHATRNWRLLACVFSSSLSNSLSYSFCC